MELCHLTTVASASSTGACIMQEADLDGKHRISVVHLKDDETVTPAKIYY